MIIEFMVRNFRSIRDELRLSFVATKDKVLSETHLAKTGIPSIPYVVQSAVIFGANASGKSNLILALQGIKDLVVTSFTGLKPGQPFNFQPFALSKGTDVYSTEFELSFILNGIRHQYGCAFNSERITEEWLNVYVTSRPQAWFHRKFDFDLKEDKYTYSSHLKGDREVWQKATRDNALFLSTAAQYNGEQLLPIYRWFAEHLVILQKGAAFNPQLTVSCLEDEGRRNLVTKLLSSADVGINGVSLAKRLLVEQNFTLKPDGSSDMTRTDREVMMPVFTHRNEEKTVTFELGQESQGTQRFFNLIGPIIDILQKGKVLIVDELDSSLHPLLVRQIVEMFHDPKLNVSGAQLVFTTHDTSLLDAPNLLRRDQIWFTEKGANQASRLTPLTEFSPRKGEALERGYLLGRYGAVPMLESFSNALSKSIEHS